ncbi:MAG: HTH-type transcriptional regulator Hpr [Caulobacteraceae bacterium]|jgi:DNA-binding MarR family transcriptional regulator|nr:HTH-type transcriptional regulator Hpr [Caulobacteraceae bacterium]
MDTDDFLEAVVLAERLHRQFLEFVQLELDALRLRDINNVRAMIVLNIGRAEMTASELLWRGCYLGSNVSYNLRKLTETGYVTQSRGAHDRRVTMVRNSAKGVALCALLTERVSGRLETLAKGGLKTEDISTARWSLLGLQQFCALAAGSRGAGPAQRGERGDRDGPPRPKRPGLAA